tara:strand:+ start:206 stop:895 length:690 start_codon:yes stop_codon:yes gene_type:complete
MAETALIVGAGLGLSASLARCFANDGIAIALAARNTNKLKNIADDTGAYCYSCDATDPTSVKDLFLEVANNLDIPDIVVYNPSYRLRGAFIDLKPEDVGKTLTTNAFGAFLVGQEAARGMLKKGQGNIQFTGASASTKGYAESAPFAMGKFALRGLAQSMARELHPKNIHISHFVVDGGIKSKTHASEEGIPDGLLDPNAIAQTYLEVTRQHRSAWAWEIELRPWVEVF